MKLTRASSRHWSTISFRDHRALPKALKDAGLTAGEIGEVVLVGGMTRMPRCRKW